MSDLDAKFRLKDDSGKGLSKNDFTDVHKNKVNNAPFDTNDILYNGSTTSANSVFISSSNGIWSSGNASIVVPVVAGQKIRIQGREFSPNSLTNVWLNGDGQTVGQSAQFAFTNFAGSAFYGDGDFTVPSGVTYLYVLFFSNVTSTTRIINLSSNSVADFLIKPESLPNRMSEKVEAQYAQTVDVTNRVKMVVTKNTYIAVGIDSNLYFDSQLTLPDSATGYFITVSGSDSSVLKLDRGIRYAPTSSKATFSLTYILRDWVNKQIASLSKNIITVNRSGGTGVKNVMFLGSSTIETGIVPFECYRLLGLDGFTINQIGTINTLYAPSVVKCEGRSGWTFANYTNDNAPTVSGTTRTNPFRKNNVLDFSAYLLDNSLQKPDIVYISLGINDVSGYTTEQPDGTFSLVASYAQTFITAMLNAWSGTKIIIALPHLGAYNPPSATAIQDIRTVNLAKLGKKFIDIFDENRFNSRVYLSDSNQMVDRIEGHSYTATPVSSRLSSVTERVYSDYVHPSASGGSGSGQGGYYQMADGAYSIIRALI